MNIATNLVAFFTIYWPYLAPEEAIGEDEVNGGEDIANEPPD